MITIDKITERNNGKVRVTFTIPVMGGCGCQCLYLVGWFDESHESVYRMQRADDGAWFLTLELDLGCDYFYRFRTDGGTWVYDPDMPRSPCRYGFKNSFIISRDIPA